MKLFSKFLSESTAWKAGGFPYFKDRNGQIYVCLFVSNNPYYGGAKPQMPKGHPDAGENPVDVAAREASEETGIPFKDLRKGAKPVTVQKFKGEVSNYNMHVFGFELNKKAKVYKNDEGEGVWLGIEDALKNMRSDQKQFLNKLYQMIK